MMHRPITVSLLATLAAICALPDMATGATKLDTPVSIAFKTVRDRRLTGKLTSFDEKGFTYLNFLDQARQVKWDDVDAKTDYLIHKKIMPKDDAKAWFHLGHRLLKREGGASVGNEALDVAVRLDAKLREPADTVRKDPNAVVDLNPPPPTTTKGGTGNANSDEPAPPPVPVFKGNARPWKMLDETRTKGVVSKLKVMAESHGKKLGIELNHSESKYFLIYSDLPITQISRYGTLLDRADRTLSSLFQLKRGTHVWYGKATVFIFGKRDHYEAFEKKIYYSNKIERDTNLHRQGDGSVIIASHRKADGPIFEDQLVRAAGEGYLYRYVSNLRLAAWIEKGLGGYVAQQLIPRGPTAMDTNTKTIAATLRKNELKLGGTFFTARKIEPWQESAAVALITHMAQRNEKEFAAFVTALKAGYTWQVSLEQFYEKTEAELLKQWGNSLGVGVVMR